MVIACVLLLCAAGAVVAARPWRCRHRFGPPINDYVCCLRCARRYPLTENAEGAWRIGSRPLD